MWNKGVGMDLAGGLAAVGQALGIAKALKDIDKSFDAATHKVRVAELYSSLAEVKMALTDAREEIHAKDGEIKRLKEYIDGLKSGEVCPICQKGRLKVVSSRPHPQFGVFGHQERTLKCDGVECGHTEKRKHEPKD